MSKFYFNGRPDGIGNRIEQLIHLSKYCEENKIEIIYIWNKSTYRNYPIYIKFKYITIKTKLEENDKNLPQYKINDLNISKLKFNIHNYDFLFKIDVEEYDTAIHIRGGDRIMKKVSTNSDFSTLNELEETIIKTSKYVNENDSIKKCIIICEEKKYITMLEKLIKKNIYKVPNSDRKYHDWQDFYYLTRATQNTIMCSKFSSFCVCASLLSNLNCITFFNDSESNLYRFNANTIKIY